MNTLRQVPEETTERHPIVRACLPTLKYWMETEVHVYGFSIAANVLLSFFPFLIVMLSLAKYVLNWPAAVDAIYFALQNVFPGQWSEWLIRNLKFIVAKRGPLQFVSIFLLFFTANGVFEPLEVALNRVWGVKVNRSFLANQIVSLGLIFVCGSLVLLSLVLTGANQQLLVKLLGPSSQLTGFAGTIFFEFAAVCVTIFSLFLIYWRLPNTKIAPARVIPVSIIVGILIEMLKYLTVVLWPLIDEKFYHEYGPFEYSAIVVVWSFLASMLVLGGAQMTARHGIEVKQHP